MKHNLLMLCMGLSLTACHTSDRLPKNSEKTSQEDGTKTEEETKNTDDEKEVPVTTTSHLSIKNTALNAMGENKSVVSVSINSCVPSHQIECTYHADVFARPAGKVKSPRLRKVNEQHLGAAKECPSTGEIEDVFFVSEEQNYPQCAVGTLTRIENIRLICSDQTTGTEVFNDDTIRQNLLCIQSID